MILLYEVDVSVLPGNDQYPLGEIHPALVMVIPESASSAEVEMRDGVRVNGWMIHRVGRFKEVAEVPKGLRDEILLGAHDQTRDRGFAMIVYREPCA